uniref:Uncharacterized protein n=1 Tax=Meloidogyne javanica TaxID=6303 RepID=A0A915LDM3_MELJA
MEGPSTNVEENVKNSENHFVDAIYGNGFYHELVNSDDVMIKNPQNIQMFMTKFRGIIFDFKWELIWSFSYKGRIYVYNPDKSADKICDLLLFRLLLEILNSMTKKDALLKFFYSTTKMNYLDAKEENIKLFDSLIGIFNEYNKKPEEFYSLNLNEKYSEKTKKMITGKVEEFIENYIDGELNVVVDRLKRN